MKRAILCLLAIVTLAGCSQLSLGGGGSRSPIDIWTEAQDALAREQFPAAEALFGELVRDHLETVEGRESLFYLGAIRLDPRNSAWNSELAESRLQQYLDIQRRSNAPRLYRYPEARTLQQIAHQLNLPMGDRIAALRSEPEVVTVPERVIVPAAESRELEAEVERLRQQVAERDARIRQQQEELERIRRTLTGPGRQ